MCITGNTTANKKLIIVSGFKLSTYNCLRKQRMCQKGGKGAVFELFVEHVFEYANTSECVSSNEQNIIAYCLSLDDNYKYN